LEHLGTGDVFGKELVPAARLDLIVRLLDQLGRKDAPSVYMERRQGMVGRMVGRASL
jgi:hypothetical protein